MRATFNWSIKGFGEYGTETPNLRKEGSFLTS
jgi:hypothetical protein